MVETEVDFSTAEIVYDSVARGPEENLIEVFRISTREGSNFFEIDYKFATNGNDFWIVVRNFGLPTAGTRSPSFRRHFRPSEAESAKRRIEEYILGAEEKRFGPFRINKGRCLGIDFAEDWIVKTS